VRFAAYVVRNLPLSKFPIEPSLTNARYRPRHGLATVKYPLVCLGAAMTNDYLNRTRPVSCFETSGSSGPAYVVFATIHDMTFRGLISHHGGPYLPLGRLRNMDGTKRGYNLSIERWERSCIG
jgi:hypothetical protein